MSSEGRGSGKVILFGEHAVVYGHRALAFSIELGTSVEIFPIQGATKITSDYLDQRLKSVIIKKVASTGAHVVIRSALPIGRGMGSSAALALALVDAAAGFHNQPLTKSQRYEEALQIERVFHGTPSGLDVALAFNPGLIAFEMGPPLQITPLGTLAGTYVTLDSGSPGDTATQVTSVRQKIQSLLPLLNDIGELVVEAQRHIHNPTQTAELLNTNHRLLQRLGVSTPELDDLCNFSLKNGALGAKLSGAGGGGIVVALVSDEERLLRAAKQNHIEATVVYRGTS